MPAIPKQTPKDDGHHVTTWRGSGLLVLLGTVRTTPPGVETCHFLRFLPLYVRKGHVILGYL